MTRFIGISTAILCGVFSALGVAQQPTPPAAVPPPVSAQTTTQPATNPSSSQQAAANPSPQKKSPEEILREEEHQRALGVVPMFGMTSYHDAPPLTSRQKFHLMAKATLDPFTWFAVGVQAGIGQAQNTFPEYGQGAAGYGSRYAAGLADSFDSNLFSNFVWPVLLKEDPRYFRLGEGTKKRRFVYALEQEFVAHTDKGGRSFNWSNSLGALTAGGISNLYYPETDRGFGLTLSRAGIALIYGSVGGLLEEFWPDINHKFHKHTNQAPPPDPPPATPSK